MKAQDRSLIQVTLTICAILASIAISAGVIAFFAHNWDSYSKTVRLLLSFFPILTGVAVFYKAFFEHHDSKVWMESAGTFLVLMTGSSTSLVAQIYHIGDFDTIILVWMLLSLPVLYLANSSSVTIVYLIGITWWLTIQNMSMFSFVGRIYPKSYETLGYWVMILAVVPHFIRYMKPGVETVRSIILGWFAVVIIFFGANMGFVSHFTFGYALAITAIYVIGKHVFYNGEHFWNRPFQSLAVAATVILSLFLSNNYFLYYVLVANNYSEFEINGRRENDFDFSPDPGLMASYLSYLLIIIFIGLIIWFVVKDFLGARRINPTIMVFPLVVMFGLILALAEHDPAGLKMDFFMPHLENRYVMAKVWFNLYILWVAAYYLYNGLNKKINGSVTLGVSILSLLLLWRYFDMQIHYILKAILYISVGAGLLLFNRLYTSQAWDEAEKEKSSTPQ